MTCSYKVEIPYWLILPRKTKEDKRVILNFNQYHNWCPAVRNQYKKLYTEALYPIISSIPKFEHIDNIEYKLFYERNGNRPDTRNITNLIDKFFCDGLVQYGVIEDDNHTIITSTTDIWGGVDKIKPRVEITIKGKKL